MGDFVSFDGTTGDISGTVVALTLRATKVRTPSGELVTVPNGSAGVITNYSQEWPRAVVNLAIPLQPGESMDDLIRTVETTVHRALKDPSIAHDVRGQIEILPATEIIAPVAAGQPWAVNFRINAEVNPAMQWAVERVVRSALLNAFWDRYDLPGSSAGVLPSRAGYSSASPIASSTDATTAPPKLSLRLQPPQRSYQVGTRRARKSRHQPKLSVPQVCTTPTSRRQALQTPASRAQALQTPASRRQAPPPQLQTTQVQSSFQKQIAPKMIAPQPQLLSPQVIMGLARG